MEENEMEQSLKDSEALVQDLHKFFLQRDDKARTVFSALISLAAHLGFGAKYIGLPLNKDMFIKRVAHAWDHYENKAEHARFGEGSVLPTLFGENKKQ